MIILNQNIKTMQNYVTDAGSFIIHIKTEDFYKDTVDNAEKWCDTSTIT